MANAGRLLLSLRWGPRDNGKISFLFSLKGKLVGKLKFCCFGCGSISRLDVEADPLGSLLPIPLLSQGSFAQPDDRGPGRVQSWKETKKEELRDAGWHLKNAVGPGLEHKHSSWSKWKANHNEIPSLHVSGPFAEAAVTWAAFSGSLLPCIWLSHPIASPGDSPTHWLPGWLDPPKSPLATCCLQGPAPKSPSRAAFLLQAWLGKPLGHDCRGSSGSLGCPQAASGATLTRKSCDVLSRGTCWEQGPTRMP